eukprot:TRINITY_DN5851_c0_g1_i1.p1 TRINITY_DN5851_c0_g1~~TRINITY_DN5851_c0_g1_i1.p1  ORF type:complete len:116 (-),score=25.10 TRINITY_DN5851_c0_g1_i1:58-375(-)
MMMLSRARRFAHSPTGKPLSPKPLLFPGFFQKQNPVKSFGLLTPFRGHVFSPQGAPRSEGRGDGKTEQDTFQNQNQKKWKWVAISAAFGCCLFVRSVQSGSFSRQ